MKKLLWILFLGALLTACGGIDSREEGIEAMLDAFDEMIDVLEDVETDDDIDDVKDELKAIGKRMDEIAKRMNELPRLEKGEQARVGKMAREGMRERSKKMQEIMSKMSPKLAQAVADAMKGIDFFK